MTDDQLKAISRAGNLHPSNKVMDILRWVVRATKEEDAKICDDLWQEDCTAMDCRDHILATK